MLDIYLEYIYLSSLKKRNLSPFLRNKIWTQEYQPPFYKEISFD